MEIRELYERLVVDLNGAEKEWLANELQSLVELPNKRNVHTNIFYFDRQYADGDFRVFGDTDGSFEEVLKRSDIVSLIAMLRN